MVDSAACRSEAIEPKTIKGLVPIHLIRPSAVVAAVSGRFTDEPDGQEQLAIATCDRIQCFTFDEDSDAILLWSFDHPDVQKIHVLNKG